MIGRAVLLCALVAVPAGAQNSDAADPLFIDVGNGDAASDDGFSTLVSDQLNQADGYFISVDDDADTPLADDNTADQPNYPILPIIDLAEGGASEIDLRDRCAAYASSLYTVTAREQMAGTARTRFRAQFARHLRAAIDARIEAGLTRPVAEDAAHSAVVPLAQIYIEIWRTTRRRTGSYFDSELRRADHTACQTLEDGGVAHEPRATITQQLETGAVGTFGQDN
ncbi:hypothetical protein [Pontivivens insulae]|uniref:Uncharacterized protein n=1 Tax=Pontivivens insulae TaxID=1639689 RepID=A0A2R8AE25_9RHOB|nr:hypothetical protein [Pontivivens insulae]RED14230.1 hypothetical protein DFR53_1586 [Pontivivens insulae]SPF30305.1 hypothetical protein POI8812_02641 [Pontivivens insulae]